MSETTLEDLQASVINKTAFTTLADYHRVCVAYLSFLNDTPPTRIVSPSQPNHLFYQYSQEQRHKITRPLNADLLIPDPDVFSAFFERFVTFLADLSKNRG